MLTDEEFRLFRNLIYEESGIYLKDTRKDFLENRLVKRMAATGMISPYWYYKFVTEKKKTELVILLDLLTINETSFFRNRPQLDLFRKTILPSLIGKKESAGQKRLRIWSAGCSTGEEPYSIAMDICEAITPLNSPLTKGGYRGGWDIRIFASDLSLTVLETASKGEYAADKIHVTVDDHYITRYFEKAPPEGNNGGRQRHYRVKDIIRKMVVFDFHNLKNDNGLSDLDVIFCRNVMIYFDEEEQKRLIEKFFRSLNPGGYLLIGHAESLQSWNTGFQFVYDNKGTAYKKGEKEGVSC
jgi:chemotaxis protein methyltransferase CheR